MITESVVSLTAFLQVLFKHLQEKLLLTEVCWAEHECVVFL